MLKKYSGSFRDGDGDPATQAERLEEVAASIDAIDAQIRRRIEESSGQGKGLGDLKEGKEELGEDVS